MIKGLSVIGGSIILLLFLSLLAPTVADIEIYRDPYEVHEELNRIEKEKVNGESTKIESKEPINYPDNLTVSMFFNFTDLASNYSYQILNILEISGTNCYFYLKNSNTSNNKATITLGYRQQDLELSNDPHNYTNNWTQIGMSIKRNDTVRGFVNGNLRNTYSLTEHYDFLNTIEIGGEVIGGFSDDIKRPQFFASQVRIYNYSTNGQLFEPILFGANFTDDKLSNDNCIFYSELSDFYVAVNDPKTYFYNSTIDKISGYDQFLFSYENINQLRFNYRTITEVYNALRMAIVIILICVCIGAIYVSWGALM